MEISPLHTETEPVASSKSTALDQVLAQASGIGVVIEDARQKPLGRIWVGLMTTFKNRHRNLTRTLIELGFEQLSGKGYWK